MMFGLHVDYPPCFVSSKLISLAYFLCEKTGLKKLSGHAHRATIP